MIEKPRNIRLNPASSSPGSAVAVNSGSSRATGAKSEWTKNALVASASTFNPRTSTTLPAVMRMEAGVQVTPQPERHGGHSQSLVSTGIAANVKPSRTCQCLSGRLWVVGYGWEREGDVMHSAAYIRSNPSRGSIQSCGRRFSFFSSFGCVATSFQILRHGEARWARGLNAPPS